MRTSRTMKEIRAELSKAGTTTKLAKSTYNLNAATDLLDRARTMSVAARGKCQEPDAKNECTKAIQLIEQAIEHLEEAERYDGVNEADEGGY